VSAEVLREAAAAIRKDQDVEENLGHIDESTYRTWLVVAEWLDAEAANRDAGIGGRGFYSVGGQSDALAVARAYLGSDR